MTNGENLKGKECGKGICQRKDGQFNARFVNKHGSMLLADIKPMHCKMVLNKMEEKYAGSTIRQTYIAMGTMLKSALMNDLIVKHPMNGVRYTKPVRAGNDIKFFTVDEQQKFLETAKRPHNYSQYALLLETGLRTGELIGLTWDAIDWTKRTLSINKTLEYRHKQGHWRTGEPAKNSSYDTHLYKLCDEGNIKRFCMHPLRHTYATNH